MAKVAARPRRRGSARRSRATSRSVQSLRLGPLWSRYRLPLTGVAVVILAAVLVNWLTGAIPILHGAREALVETLGIGVFGIVLAVILAGLGLATGARRLRLPALRRLSGALVWTVFALGIVALFRPAWELGDVSLAQTTAGGDLGDALTSPLGALVMLALAIGGGLLISPQRTVRALQLTGSGLAAAAEYLRHHLPVLSPGFFDRAADADPWLLDESQTATLDAPATPQSPATAANTADTATITRPAKPPAGQKPAAKAAAADATSDADATSTSPTSDDGTQEPEADAKAGPKRRRSDDGWQLPSLDLLTPDPPRPKHNEGELQGQIVVDTLASFGIDARVAQINEGPSVTQIGIEPGWDIKTRRVTKRDEDGELIRGKDGRPILHDEEVGRTRVRVNRITRLTNDIALGLAASSIRVQAPVPGQSVVGIEVPNRETATVSLRGVIDSPEFRRFARKGGLPIPLGRDVSGRPVLVDLTRMPHLLIAGATGSGKSVAINIIIASLLMQFSPAQLRLVAIDPKRVELTGYNHVPHLAFSHVVTDPDEVVGVLGVIVSEMERRYRRFEQVGARNIDAYNKQDRPEGRLPYWVVILDELADLMLAAPAEVEQQLVRLAQLARATGIHLVVATQRPSVDVVTGLIKANFPTRIAFATASQTDSRVIMDRAGAEQLLGRGDMLFVSQDNIQPLRVQGAFVSDEEIAALIGFWTQDRFKNVPRPTLDHLLDEAREAVKQRSEAEPAAAEAGHDSLYEDAVSLARDHTRVSASLLQRRLRVGYPRAARLIDMLEEAGVVGPAEGAQSREVRPDTEPARID